MTEWDENDEAVPGTFAHSTVCIIGAKEDGTPVARVTSAVCDVCGSWASAGWFASDAKATDLISTDVRVSRRSTIAVYACPSHSEQVMHALVDEFGGASNAYDADELAAVVSRYQMRV